MPLPMNRNLIVVPVVVVSTMAAFQAFGQAGANPAARLVELPAKTELNQFRVSARMGYNISAHLENIGVPAGQAFPQPPAPNDPTRHFVSATGVSYVDGYVGVDESGNNPGAGSDARGFSWRYAERPTVRR